MQQNIIEALSLTLVGGILDSDNVKQSVVSTENQKLWIVECSRKEDFTSLLETSRELIAKGYEMNFNLIHLRETSSSGLIRRELKFDVSTHIRSPLIQVSTPVICQKAFSCTKPVLIVDNTTDQIYFVNEQWKSLNINTNIRDFYRCLDSSVLWNDKSDLAMVRELTKQGESIENLPTTFTYPGCTEGIKVLLDVRPVHWLGYECRAEIHKPLIAACCDRNCRSNQSP